MTKQEYPARKIADGWGEMIAHDNALLIPATLLSTEDQKKLKDDSKGYHFSFQGAMEREVEGHVLMNDGLKSHPFDTRINAFVMLFNENEISIKDAVIHDMGKAQQEIEALPHDTHIDVWQKAKERIAQLKVLDKIITEGEEKYLLPQDFLDNVIDVGLKKTDGTLKDGIKLITYEHRGL